MLFVVSVVVCCLLLVDVSLLLDVGRLVLAA